VSTAGTIIRAQGLTKRFGDFSAWTTFRCTSRAIDLRLPRRQRLGQEHDHPHADRAARAQRGHDRGRRHRRHQAPAPGARSHRLHGAEVSLYQGLSLREKRRVLCRAVRLSSAQLAERWGALRERFSLGEAEREKPDDLPPASASVPGSRSAPCTGRACCSSTSRRLASTCTTARCSGKLIQDEAESGVTVFVTTHFLEEADYCDWVSFIDAGQLVADASPAELRRRFSDGYRIELTIPDGAARPRLAAFFAEHGLACEPRPTASPCARRARRGLLRVMRRRSREAPGTACHVEQPEMTEVFRVLMRRVAADGAKEAA